MPKRWNFPRILNTLAARQEVPRHTRLHSRRRTRVPPTYRGAPFPPHSSRGGILSLRGLESIPGVSVASQEVPFLLHGQSLPILVYAFPASWVLRHGVLTCRTLRRISHSLCGTPLPPKIQTTPQTLPSPTPCSGDPSPARAHILHNA